MFIPQLETLPEAQRVLWAELGDVPAEFALYGGTAIALQLAHRESIDFDFFSGRSFNPVDLYQRVGFLDGSLVLQQEQNTLTCSVDRGQSVKVSFFGLPKLKRVRPLLKAQANGLQVASLLDLAGMKAAVVQQRAEAKDYIDLDALMQHGVDLAHALAAAIAIYGSAFNPQITLKALSYFGDGDLIALPDALKLRIARAVVAVDLDALPSLEAESAR